MSTEILINGTKVAIEGVERKKGMVHFTLNGHAYSFHGTRAADGTFTLTEGEQRHRGTLWSAGKGGFKVQLGAQEIKVAPVLAAAGSATATETPLSPMAPMPGLVRQVLVKKGDKVTKGQALAVMEAMKLQTTLSAGGDGVVVEILVKPGELVSEGAELVRLSAKAA